MKTTLLIMAAGIGSRFGTGIKQLEPVDDAGEHLVPHTHIGYAAHGGKSWGYRIGVKRAMAA